MPYFSIQTRGPGFTQEFASIEDAADWVQQYLPLTARGWYHSQVTSEHVDARGRRVTYRHVLVHNSRGRVVNGAWVRPALAEDMRLATR